MKINLDSSKRPVKFKVWRNPAQQGAYFGSYLSQLAMLWYMEPNANALWQAVPQLVPRESPTKFKITIDTRPVNTATIKEQWPMTNIDAELSDFKDTRCFASLDLSAGYWQCPHHPCSYDACWTQHCNEHTCLREHFTVSRMLMLTFSPPFHRFFTKCARR